MTPTLSRPRPKLRGTCVLIVDRDASARGAARVALAAKGYRALEVGTARAAMAAARAQRADLVLLELDLPDGDGLDLITAVRRWSQIPIIVVSTRLGEHDKIIALERGADDYVTKPFSAGELAARVGVGLRRGPSLSWDPATPVLRAGDIVVDLVRRIVLVGKREVHLTPNEYDLLAYLMRHPNQVVTHYQILKEVWGRTEVSYLRVYITALRQKLAPEPGTQANVWILTESGVGYRLKFDD